MCYRAPPDFRALRHHFQYYEYAAFFLHLLGQKKAANSKYSWGEIVLFSGFTMLPSLPILFCGIIQNSKFLQIPCRILGKDKSGETLLSDNNSRYEVCSPKKVNYNQTKNALSGINVRLLETYFLSISETDLLQTTNFSSISTYDTYLKDLD